MTLPLEGRTVLVTRAQEQQGEGQEQQSAETPKTLKNGAHGVGQKRQSPEPLYHARALLRG